MGKEKGLLTARETAAFCSQLAYIVKAGVPVREGVSIMADDADDGDDDDDLGDDLSLDDE